MARTSYDTWWKHAVFYQIYPLSFADSDGDSYGDLRGIISRLDYLSSTLGVDAIWLSPFFKSPMRDWGYDISDHTDVDPLMGDLSDAAELVTKAHGLGLRVIIDYVINHTSDQHAWFVESRSSRDNPKRDWYVWRDGRDGDGDAVLVVEQEVAPGEQVLVALQVERLGVREPERVVEDTLRRLERVHDHDEDRNRRQQAEDDQDDVHGSRRQHVAWLKCALSGHHSP